MQIKKILLAFCVSLMVVLHTSAQEFPEKPSTLVSDFTNTLSPEQVNQLEQKLVAFDDSTSTQIAVVIIKSLGGYDISEYAARLGEKWGVGRDKKNNGVVLLVALEDRKVTIQTGYGVEGALPDAIARRIIENEIKPGFKDGDYYAGIDKGTDAIISYTKGEYKNDEPRKKGDGKGGIPFGLIFLIIVVIVISISRRGGGGGSNVIGSGGTSPLWWMLMGNAMGGGGRSSGGGFGGFSGGGGGGGFGGFGGGGFGGGGASGSW